MDSALHFFQQKRHPREMGEVEVGAFFSHLAVLKAELKAHIESNRPSREYSIQPQMNTAGRRWGWAFDWVCGRNEGSLFDDRRRIRQNAVAAQF